MRRLECSSRLLKNPYSCHPEVAPVLRDRRICFIFSTRKQQILRCAEDDTFGEQFFSSLLALGYIIPVIAVVDALLCGLFSDIRSRFSLINPGSGLKLET
jgi:hypothetical protein